MDGNDWKNGVEIKKPIKIYWTVGSRKRIITAEEWYLITPRKQEGD